MKLAGAAIGSIPLAAVVLGFRYPGGGPGGGPVYFASVLLGGAVLWMNWVVLTKPDRVGTARVGAMAGVLLAPIGVLVSGLSRMAYDVGQGQTSWIEVESFTVTVALRAFALVTLLSATPLARLFKTDNPARAAQWVRVISVLIGAAAYWTDQILIGYDLSHLR